MSPLNSDSSASKIPSRLVAEDESFADLVVEFLDGLSGRLADMQQAVETSDFEALKMLCHQLKGSGAGYGYPGLTEFAARMEQEAAARESAACAASLEELKSLATRLVVK